MGYDCPEAVRICRGESRAYGVVASVLPATVSRYEVLPVAGRPSQSGAIVIQASWLRPFSEIADGSVSLMNTAPLSAYGRLCSTATRGAPGGSEKPVWPATRVVTALPRSSWGPTL